MPPMLISVHAGRLIAATLLCAAFVLGVSSMATKAGAQGGKVNHTCSAPDKQYLQIVGTNMFQLSYWSDQLQKGEATPLVVVKQTKSGSAQVDSTRPTDPTLEQTRPLLKAMFLAYAKAVQAKALGGNAGTFMGIAYQLANDVHDLLAAAGPPLAAKGCDVAVLLSS
jgi:hypothetical protein